ncbi:PREDICTED: 39S ribosomal protein L28, mitochondrial [Dufourea novaeangliae]|uniref:39S ribosomal protein L28, mitochondrial n=1 Tax=Dufourea novaeangliae TaxID=178035 RepID=UPI0007673297|nr:PREDICTED: 39S ribosomal protein L28, mitochondrial [Dufourea novaeangliae]
MSMKQFGQRLYYIPKITRWSKGIGAELPEEYKKFWREWKLQVPTAVHYIKQEGSYVRDEETGVVRPVQNVPLPLLYPKEINGGIWGGETVVQGFRKKGKYYRRSPHFWFPGLKKSVLYSEVLDTYMRVVVTNRTINLIHEHYGFDHYLLKTPACDLRSELALKIKRRILLALLDKTLYPNDPAKGEEIFAKYKEYLTAYTREEIEWYGLTYKEACIKWINLKNPEKELQPLKIQYRSELIDRLEQNKIADAAATSSSEESSSWMSKLNPFGKSYKTK